MRILDSEAHAINPAGIDCCYPMEPRWRYPYIAAPNPKIRPMIAEAVANDRYDNHTDTLISRMDHHGIEKAVIMRGAFPTKNADLAAIIAKHPDRFVGFTSWDVEPTAGTPPHETIKSLTALEKGFTEFGFLGAGEFSLDRYIPLPPDQAYLGYIPIMELCRKHKKPIMFHTGYDGGKVAMGYRNPIMFEPLAFEFPDVPIMICHMGKYDMTFFEYAMMLARKNLNVYLTTSNAKMEFIERAVAEIGPERIVFGSDWSMQHGILGERQGFDVYEENLDAVRKAKLDEGEKRMILGENLANLLGI